LQYQLHNGSIAEPVLEKVILSGQAKHTVVAQPAPEQVESPTVQTTAYASIPVVEEAVTLLPVEALPPLVVPQVEAKLPIINDIIETAESTAATVLTTVPETVANNATSELSIASVAASSVTEQINENGIVDYTAFALSNSLKHVAPVVTNEAPAIVEPPKAPLTEDIGKIINENSGGFAIPTLETVKRLLDVNTPSTSIAPAIHVETPKTNIASIPSYSFNGFADAKTPLAPNAVALSEAFTEEEVDVIDEHDKHPINNIASVLSSQIADFKKPITEDAKLEFDAEPLFKVDYFASQGIKIDLTKQPQDKLTVQLRRFTDWLRQIKGQGPNPPQDLGTDPELEKAIANIARTSIAAREIVTETMADVFIKQGKVDKAIQLYIKLSFLDPEKSVYFAGKIQQLKGI